MAAIGGDIREITYTHPTVGSGSFFPKSDEDGTFKKGGFMAEDDDTGITGAGEAIYKINRNRWSMEVVIRSDMSARGQDLERLQALSDSPQEANWTIEMANGTVYAAIGKPVGSIEHNTNDATLTFKVQGGGQARIIVSGV